MRRVTQVMRARVELQGFGDLPDETIRDINYWLRLPPLIIGAWTAGALLTRETWLIWALVPVTALGAILPRHPFDAIYLLVRRPPLGHAAMPDCGPPRRFAWGVESAMLAVVGACLEGGRYTAGSAVGLTLLLAVGVHVATGFCVGSWLYSRVRVWRVAIRGAGLQRHRLREGAASRRQRLTRLRR